MRRRLCITSAIASLIFCAAALAFEFHIGTIVSTGTSVNNQTTGTTFVIPPGAPMAIQCDSAAYVLAGAGSATSVSGTSGAATRGVLIQAGQLYDVPMVSTGTLTADTIAVISVSGTANCEAYRVVTQ